MEERKALEAKVGNQGVARGVPFPCPCPVGPSPMDTAALGPQLLIPLCRERGGQAQAEGRVKDVHGVGSMLQRKGGHGPCQEESPWFFLPFTPCFRYPHLFPGSWIPPHPKFRWRLFSSHPHQGTNPATLQAPLTPHANSPNLKGGN